MEKIIEVEGLTKRFNHFTAVDNLSFNVRRGEIFSILGPNGAGKSTTIRMLCTLLRPTSGKVFVAGHDLIKQPHRVREHIGLVAEKIILYDRLTALENLKFFGLLYHLSKREIQERSEKWLKALQMDKWKNKLVGTFSTGMKQRVNIARALLTNPEILFLDEPTLGLDPQTSKAIREFIRNLKNQGVTIILTTHIMPEADELSDRVAIMNQGKIIALDTPEKLKAKTKKKNANLEDVFLHLTGRKMRDEIKETIPIRSKYHFQPPRRIR